MSKVLEQKVSYARDTGVLFNGRTWDNGEWLSGAGVDLCWTMCAALPSKDSTGKASSKVGIAAAGRHWRGRVTPGTPLSTKLVRFEAARHSVLSRATRQASDVWLGTYSGSDVWSWWAPGNLFHPRADVDDDEEIEGRDEVLLPPLPLLHDNKVKVFKKSEHVGSSRTWAAANWGGDHFRSQNGFHSDKRMSKLCRGKKL